MTKDWKDFQKGNYIHVYSSLQLIMLDQQCYSFIVDCMNDLWLALLLYYQLICLPGIDQETVLITPEIKEGTCTIDLSPLTHLQQWLYHHRTSACGSCLSWGRSLMCKGRAERERVLSPEELLNSILHPR